jgi:Domain of unknown function (DUF4345)
VSGRILAFALFLLGLSALAIGIAIFALGPERVGLFFNDMLAPLSASAFANPPEAWTRDGDSEMRFYSVFWAAYGIALLFIARDIVRFRIWVPLLLGLFLLGGVGRAISIIQFGWPHPLFTVLMAVELALPVILLVLHAMARPPKMPEFGR